MRTVGKTSNFGHEEINVALDSIQTTSLFSNQDCLYLADPDHGVPLQQPFIYLRILKSCDFEIVKSTLFPHVMHGILKQV